MENRINTYGYAVFSNGKMPLHIVQINHNMLSAFSVFCSAKDAKDYIMHEKESLEKYAVLKYDPNFHFCKSLVKAYTDSKNGHFCKLENRQVYIA